MKILSALLISLPLICTPLAAHADKGGNKGPSDSAWEHANDNASFKRKHDDRQEHHDKWKKNKGDRDGRYGDRDGYSRDPNRYWDDRYEDRNYRDRDSRYGDRDGRGSHDQQDR